MNDSLDRNIILELKEIMADDFTILVDTYLEDARVNLQRLQEAWEQRDWHTLNRGAHSLKGSSGNIGASKLSALCAEVEKRALAEEAVLLEALLGEVVQEYSRVVNSIRELH